MFLQLPVLAGFVRLRCLTAKHVTRQGNSHVPKWAKSGRRCKHNLHRYVTTLFGIGTAPAASSISLRHSQEPRRGGRQQRIGSCVLDSCTGRDLLQVWSSLDRPGFLLLEEDERLILRRALAI